MCLPLSLVHLGHVFEGMLYFTKDIVDDKGPNPFRNLQPRRLESPPEGATLCNCLR